MVTVRNLLSITGGFSGVGQTIMLSCGLSMVTYSSKLSVILLLLKCVEESEGVAFTKTGGKESLGPPVGGMILAQENKPLAIATANNKKRGKTKKERFMNIRYSCKHKLFEIGLMAPLRFLQFFVVGTVLAKIFLNNESGCTLVLYNFYFWL